jgi:hypothetical protein
MKKQSKMKVVNLEKCVVTTYEMQVEMPPGYSNFYTRHDDLGKPYWTYDVSYDIHGETYDCDEEFSGELEAVFQEHKDCIE